jgi:hypothetical protein
MRVNDVINYFGSLQAVATELGLRSPGAITNWRLRYRGRVPELWARKLDDITRGELRFKPSDYGLPR